MSWLLMCITICLFRIKAWKLKFAPARHTPIVLYVRVEKFARVPNPHSVSAGLPTVGPTSLTVLYITSFPPRVRTTTPGRIGSDGVATDFAQPVFGPFQIVAADTGTAALIAKINNPTSKILIGNSDLRFVM